VSTDGQKPSFALVSHAVPQPIRRLLDRAAARYKSIPGNDCASFIASSLYKRPGDVEQAMQIRAEGGSWKLAAVNPTALGAS
jgi:hypothetical protein